MSRGRRAALFVVCVLAVAIAVWLERSPVAHTWQAQPDDFSRYHAKTFTVVKVVDGDTLDIDVPDDEYDCTRIRLWGIDTPETKSTKYGVMYFGPEAAQFATELVLGEDVTVWQVSERGAGCRRLRLCGSAFQARSVQQVQAVRGRRPPTKKRPVGTCHARTTSRMATYKKTEPGP